MRKYARIIALEWSSLASYRADIALEAAGNAFLMLATILFWKGVFLLQKSEAIHAYTSSELTAYLISASFLSLLLFRSSQGDDINDDINRGALSAQLAKPLSPFGAWFARDMARRVYAFLISLSVAAFLVFAFRIPFPSFSSLLLFFSFLPVAVALHYAIFTPFALAAFWWEQTWGQRFAVRAIMETASGMFAPISFFPDVWKSFFEALPFRFLVFVPGEIIRGSLDAGSVVRAIGEAAAWTVALAAVCLVLWKRGIRVYQAEEDIM